MHTPLLMGILNLTPDSFSDGGLNANPKESLKSVKHMVEYGANIIDIGAESTRPKFIPVDANNQIERLKVLPQLIKEFPEVTFSLDTTLPEVAQFGVDSGIKIFNDISYEGIFNPKTIKLLQENPHIDYVLTHNLAGMKEQNSRTNSPNHVIEDLSKAIEYAKDNGIKSERVIIDPGLGFNKTAEENWEILSNLNIFSKLPNKLLIGHSRKRFTQFMGTKNFEQADNITSMITTHIANYKVWAVRVHNIKLNYAAIEIAKKFGTNG